MVQSLSVFAVVMAASSRFSHPRRETPRPAFCAGPAPGGPRGRRCHHPLTDTPVVGLDPDGALAQTQRLVEALLAALDKQVHWPLYGPGGAPLRTMLGDARCLGGLILSHAAPGDMADLAEPAVLHQLQRYRSLFLPAGSQQGNIRHPLDRHNYHAPGDAAAAAVAMSAAVQILTAESVPAAAEATQWLTDRVAATGRPLHPGGVALLGGGVSSGLQAALRCSREAKVMPVARLRHRTAIASTRSPSNRDRRARMLPTALWPEWSLRLAPWHASGKPVARRADELLAVACLLVGNTA